MKSIATLNSIIKAKHAALANLIELDIQPYGGSVTTVRLATGWYQLQWNGNQYYAAGNAISIEPMKETIGNKAEGATLRVSGVDGDLRTMALDAAYAYPGRPVRIYLAGLNADYTVADADLRFAGFVNKMVIKDSSKAGGGQSIVTIQCENKLVRLRQAANRRMSDEQQRKLHPADTGFRHLVNMRERVFAFGPKSQ